MVETSNCETVVVVAGTELVGAVVPVVVVGVVISGVLEVGVVTGGVALGVVVTGTAVTAPSSVVSVVSIDSLPALASASSQLAGEVSVGVAVVEEVASVVTTLVAGAVLLEVVLLELLLSALMIDSASMGETKPSSLTSRYATDCADSPEANALLMFELWLLELFRWLITASASMGDT